MRGFRFGISWAYINTEKKTILIMADMDNDLIKAGYINKTYKSGERLPEKIFIQKAFKVTNL